MQKIIIVLFVLISTATNAQDNFMKAASIQSYKLEVTAKKTTNLVFPASILSIDRGSQDIVVQKVTGVENILRVKADVRDFEETSLSIVTSDGRLYSFIVNYAQNPAYLNLDLGMLGAIVQPQLHEINLAENAATVTHRKNNIHSLSDDAGKVSLDVNGFYIRSNTIFCKLHLQNSSQISYGIEQIRFYIKDKQQSKRTSSQEVELKPEYIFGDTSAIEGKTARLLVVALPKFTMPDGKYLSVEIMEKNGGRHLSIHAKNRHIMKAKTIS